MKKYLLLTTLALLAFSSEAKSCYRGDINLSGTIDKEDIQLLAQILTGKSPMPTNITLYDVNGDNRLTLADLTALIETYKGNLKTVTVWVPDAELPIDGPGTFD